MNKQNLFIILIGILLLSVVYMIVNNMQKPLTETTYIGTSYLYVFGSLLFLIISSALFNKYHVFDSLTDGKMIAIFILSLISLCGIMVTSSSQQVLKHILLIIFLLTLTVSAYSIYQVAYDNNILSKVLITVGVIIVAMSWIAYSQPLDVFNSWGIYLFFGLLTLIIMEALDIIFNDPTNYHYKVWGWITTIMFSFFMIYDTQKLRQNAVKVLELCKTQSQFECTDYPTQSLGLLLDILNLFQGVTSSQT